MMNCDKCQPNKKCKRCYDKARYVVKKDKILKQNKRWRVTHKEICNKHSAKRFGVFSNKDLKEMTY